MSDKRCNHCVERLAKAIAQAEGLDCYNWTPEAEAHYISLGEAVFDEIMAIRDEVRK